VRNNNSLIARLIANSGASGELFTLEAGTKDEKEHD